MAENARSCDTKSDHTTCNTSKDDDTFEMTSDEIKEQQRHEHPMTSDVVTPAEKAESQVLDVWYQRSTPMIRHALSNGSMSLNAQDITTHKLTVLKISQLLRRTRKLLTSSQEQTNEP